MKYLITGGAGFIGGNIAVKLATDGHEIFCIDNLSRRGSENNLKRFLDHKNIRFEHCDIRNKEDLRRIDFNPDVTLECSAQTTAVDGYQNPIYDFTNNTTGVINVLEHCREKNSGLIFWSSNKAYSGDFCNSIPTFESDTRFKWQDVGNLRGWTKLGFNEEGDLNGGNHTIYGVTKNAADLLIQEWSVAFDIPAIINRFSCIYGPYQFGKVSQGWIVWFALAKKFDLDLSYYGFEGKQVRDCLHIDDLYDLILKQSNMLPDHRGSYYNVGGGIENTTSIRELNDLLDKLIPGDHKKVKISNLRRADQKIYISDITKVSRDFDWSPSIDLRSGIDTVIDWINDEREDFSWMKRN